jgi:hypothetical protein
MWPKGDGWGGGGHFLSQTRIALNHRDGELELADGFSVPRWLKMKQFGPRPGWGEDDPIWSERLKRDGWKLIGYPDKTKDEFGGKVWMEFSPAIKWRKANPKWPKRLSLDMSIIGIKENDGPWYLIEHSVIHNGSASGNIGRSDWADWSPSGDLLFALDGCIYRAPCKEGVLTPLEDAIKLADFSGLKFERREAPVGARRWPCR